MKVSFSKYNSADFSLVAYAACLNPVPYLQSIVSSHLDLPPSNQQIMDRTKTPLYIFLSIIRFTRMYSMSQYGLSIVTSATLQL